MSNQKRGGESRIEDKFEAKRRAWERGVDHIETSHQVVLGDSRYLRSTLGDEPVHLIVTSPPYWNLKVYAHDRDGAQLGGVDDRTQFLDGLREVWKECFRSLVPGGRMCVVVGDVCRSRRSYGRHVVEPLHSYLQVQLQEMGFDPLAPIIWQKIANMATEVAGKGQGFLGKPYEPNAIVKNDIEYILMFRKPGGYRHPTQEQRDLSVIEKEEYRQWFQQIWTDVRGEPQRKHPAPFPVEVARRLIKMFSFVGDTVLDPFLGTGSTTLAAMESHRSSIGVDVEPTYIKLVRDRIGDVEKGGEDES